VNPDLSHFAGIVPCGISSSEGSVTSMRAELGHPVDPDEVKLVLAREFQAEWAAFLRADAARHTTAA
jgi:lipoyl(octanoyl) transferase